MSDFASTMRVVPHPGNVREDVGDVRELADSILAHGILQPLVVRPHPQKHGYFVVLAGHRRLAAAKLAGLDEVPIVIRQSAGPGKDVEVMLVENLQRTDLSPIEKAEAMGKLRDRGYTATRIASSVGLSQSTVSYYLAFLDMDEKTRAGILAGTVQVGDAIAAVRGARKRYRARTGQRPKDMRLTWEPDHFTTQHPLARKARAMCEAREHNNRRRIGKIACGQCWETVVRADERTAAAVLEGVS